ncbi:MAG: endonuclease/exonuclease/phosphatase family protein [Alloprevotella sp.]|nr:endonuclease/exonuclease/phosphatase family protein [Alloprevotella sp.]
MSLPARARVFIIICVACFLAAAAQDAPRRFRLVELNVENLFDTVHDAGHDDYEFLPAAPRCWDSRRYWAKQGRLARLLAACGGDRPADLVALCEVENDSVLADLTRRTHLGALGYEFLITRSADTRGIDVALLYQPLRFRPLHTDHLRPAQPPGLSEERPLRDALHVAGLLPTGDTLDVFVCHLPSRVGGWRHTQPRRVRAAAALRASIDSVARYRRIPRLIVAGDFNDELRNRSLRTALQVADIRGGIRPEGLYDLAPRASDARRVGGTYKFRNTWYTLDHILVSGTLLQEGASLRTSLSACRIADFPFLLEAGADGGLKPRRTYLGPHYHGGFSDHLPLMVDFWY